MALPIEVCLVNGASDHQRTSPFESGPESTHPGLNPIIHFTSYVTLDKLLVWPQGCLEDAIRKGT